MIEATLHHTTRRRVAGGAVILERPRLEFRRWGSTVCDVWRDPGSYRVVRYFPEGQVLTEEGCSLDEAIDAVCAALELYGDEIRRMVRLELERLERERGV